MLCCHHWRWHSPTRASVAENHYGSRAAALTGAAARDDKNDGDRISACSWRTRSRGAWYGRSCSVKFRRYDSVPDRDPDGAVAVSYLRVSTKEQAEKGGTDEGYSIPAQREANRRKAAQLGATVIEEFVDAGESARKADRPELMRMIQYVTEHQVNYCIVHKVDRLARNRADDVTIHLALRDAGVMLVSASENIDETPSGMLLHGIMSSIAEFYSRNLATETIKGLSQKAAQGGTINRAPMGYLNVGVRDERGP